MSVTRYRDVGDMPPPPRVTGPELAARIRALWQRAMALARPEPVRGVQRFHSLEEAQAAREVATIQRLRRQRHDRAR